jgi:hypothetical protein
MAKKARSEEQILGRRSRVRVASEWRISAASTTSAKHVLCVKEKVRRAGAEPTA